MHAVDANVVARFILDDDAAQHAAAKEVMGAPEVFLGVTVVLELSWLFLKIYRLPKSAVLETLAAVIRLPNVTVERRPMVEQALEWALGGIDIADALHLAAARDCEAMVSFDRSFARRAQALGASPAVASP